VRVFTCDNWNTVENWSTPSGRWVGIAIASESHEAIVRVAPDGLLLQAGRVLAIRTDGAAYKLSRHIVPRSQFTEISKLQVICFECIEELSSEVARATGTFSTSRVGVDITATVWPAVATILDVPFVGRRQAMVSLNNADVSDVGITITGRRWNESKGAIESCTLVTVNPGDFTGTCLAEHVGGTNEAEAWHALRISGGMNAGAGNVFVDVECIGEIGAR
jgi:hypothetical protein